MSTALDPAEVPESNSLVKRFPAREMVPARQLLSIFQERGVLTLEVLDLQEPASCKLYVTREEVLVKWRRFKWVKFNESRPDLKLDEIVPLALRGLLSQSL